MNACTFELKKAVEAEVVSAGLRRIPQESHVPDFLERNSGPYHVGDLGEEDLGVSRMGEAIRHILEENSISPSLPGNTSH